MKKLKTFLFGVVIILIYVTFSFPSEQNVNKYKLPENPHREDIVSLNLACKIALYRAKKEFGQEIVSGNPIIGLKHGIIRLRSMTL